MNVTKIPDAALIPIIAILSIVGSYAIHNSFFDVILMFGFGIIGYLFSKFDLNNAAIVLALILGILAEKGFRRTLVISGGDYSALVTSSISIVLITIILVSLLSPLLKMIFKRIKK